MEKKYDTLLERLQKYKDAKSCSTIRDGAQETHKPSQRRKTIASAAPSSLKSAVGLSDKRKLQETKMRQPSPKKLKSEDTDMRKKLEEWRKQKGDSRQKENTNPKDSNRAFIPTGPYGVSFGINVPTTRKSLPAVKIQSQKPVSKGQRSSPRLSLLVKKSPKRVQAKVQSGLHQVKKKRADLNSRDAKKVDEKHNQPDWSNYLNVLKTNTNTTKKTSLGQSNSTIRSLAKPIDKRLSVAKPIGKRLSIAKQKDKRLSVAKPNDKRLSVAKPNDKRLSVAKPNDKRLSVAKPNDKRLSVAKPNDKRLSVAKPNDKTLSVAKHNEKRLSVAKPNDKRLSVAKPNDKGMLVSKPKGVTKITPSIYTEQNSKTTNQKSKEMICHKIDSSKSKTILKESKNQDQSISTGSMQYKTPANFDRQRTIVRNIVSLEKGPATRVQIIDEPKKKKFKFVASRIDTGLSNTNNNAVAKKKRKSPIKVNRNEQKPRWNFTPKIDCKTISVSKNMMFGGDNSKMTIPNKQEKQKKSFSVNARVTAKQSMGNKPDKVEMNKKRRSILKSAPVDKNKNNVRFAARKSDEERSMRLKLDKWLEDHGKTPSKYSTLRSFGHEISAKKKITIGKRETNKKKSTNDDIPRFPIELIEEEEDEEMNPVNEKLNQLLAECKLLLDSGCPVSNVSVWLEEIVSGIPQAKQSAKYWICRANIVEKQDEGDDCVIDVYEEAVRHDVKDPDEIAESLKEFVLRMREKQQKDTSTTRSPPRLSSKTASLLTPLRKSPLRTPGRTPRRSLIQPELMFRSSAIKYRMTETTTPFFKRLRTEMGDLTLTPQAVVTPVRRSARLSNNSCLPAMLQDHSEVLDDLEELPVNLHVLFQKNLALESSSNEEDSS